MPKQPAADAAPTIDPRSAQVVLAYVEDSRAPRDVPARDLSGGDLARLAYVRALQVALDEHTSLVPDGEDGPAPIVRPGIATTDELEAIAAELVASGAFIPYVPPAPDAGTTSASPAEQPEA